MEGVRGIFNKKLRMEVEELWDLVRKQQRAIDSLAKQITFSYCPLVIDNIELETGGKDIYAKEVLQLLLDKMDLAVKYNPAEVALSEFKLVIVKRD